MQHYEAPIWLAAFYSWFVPRPNLSRGICLLGTMHAKRLTKETWVHECTLNPGVHAQQYMKTERSVFLILSLGSIRGVHFALCSDVHLDRLILLNLIWLANFVSSTARMQREGFLATRGYLPPLGKECRLCTVIVVSECLRSMFKRSNFFWGSMLQDPPTMHAVCYAHSQPHTTSQWTFFNLWICPCQLLTHYAVSLLKLPPPWQLCITFKITKENRK